MREDPPSGPEIKHPSRVATPSSYLFPEQEVGPFGGIGEALRALKRRIGKVLEEAERQPVLKRILEEAGDQDSAGEPLRVSLFAFPVEGTGGERETAPYNPADPLGAGPPPPLAPVFLVVAGGANHDASVERIEALLANLASWPLLLGEAGRLFRADRVDLDLMQALALRQCPEPGTAPFLFVRIRQVGFGTRRRPERVTESREEPGKSLGPLDQMLATIREGLNSFVFEPNDPDTGAAIKGMALGVAHDFWKEGHLQGKRAEDACWVECGLGRTMTAEDILKGYVVLTISWWMPDLPLDEDPYRHFTFVLQNGS